MSNQLVCKTEEYASDYLKKTKENGLLRTLIQKNFSVEFSSNDYLGVSKHREVINYGIKFANRYGSGSNASRIVFSSLEKEIKKLEIFFSSWVKFEDSLLFPSGFMANCGILETFGKIFNEAKCELFLDHRSHASLHVACKLSKLKTLFYEHKKYELLRKKLLQSEAEVKIIVLESVHSMDGDAECASSLQKICEETNSLIFLDDSHGIGVFGENGNGWLGLFPALRKFVLAASYGCGKALGVNGGFVACSKNLKNSMLQCSKFFVYTTAMSPFQIGSLIRSICLLSGRWGNNERNRLQCNLKFLKQKISEQNITQFIVQSLNQSSEILTNNTAQNILCPITYYKTLQLNDIVLLQKKFLNANIGTRIMRPPTVPKGTERFRIIVRSNHSLQNLNSLIQVFT
jgi:8-amino-7-oxononanoate synthase